jgi:hypothetical protein
LLLLDGLDEVLGSDSNAVVKEIRRFSENYEKNLFVTTCRTARQTFTLNRFTDVEIAPLLKSKLLPLLRSGLPHWRKRMPRMKSIQPLSSLRNWACRKLAIP